MRYVHQLVPFLLLSAAPLVAQVGHEPSKSPYRDIRRGHTVTATFGHIGGDGGRFGIGPHDGPTFGLRYDIRNSRALQLGLGLSYAQLERLIVDPFVRLDERTSGPVDQDVVFAEFDLQFNLTGGKSWNHLAPFLGLGGGLTFANSTAADTSGFNFGRKFYLVPTAGVRVFVTQRVHVRAEARAAFWKLTYPVSFQQEPPAQPGTVQNPNAVITDNDTSEWVTSSWLQIGLGFGI